MKILTIRNFGPIASAKLELKSKNIIFGPQSSGKSCVLKIACFCSWVEKRIQLTQDPNLFRNSFIDKLQTFHKLEDYCKDDSFISYESEFMFFSYNHTNKLFEFKWKKERWNYKKTKVSYIPAERNMVAVIPNWFDIKLDNNNIRSFMSDWEMARKIFSRQQNILNLGVSYHFDSTSGTDKITINNSETNKSLDLTNASSGLQSIVPLYIYLNYLLNVNDYEKEKTNISNIAEQKYLLNKIHNSFFESNTESNNSQAEIAEYKLGQYSIGFFFASKEEFKLFDSIATNFLSTSHTDIFLEEPELSLFPPTQVTLINWLLDSIKAKNDNLFIATHSPYIVTTLLENNEKEDLGMFFIHSDGELTTVKNATPEQIQQIYNYGIDVFFNIESL